MLAIVIPVVLTTINSDESNPTMAPTTFPDGVLVQTEDLIVASFQGAQVSLADDRQYCALQWVTEQRIKNPDLHQDQRVLQHIAWQLYSTALVANLCGFNQMAG